MKKFKISMKGDVNGIETTFSLQIDFTESQLQQFVVQQALLEAEHKGFEDVTILSVEEASPEYVQMKLFPDEEVEESSSPTQGYQAYQDSSNQTGGSFAESEQFDEEDSEEEFSEEDTMGDEECCETPQTCSSNYKPYNTVSSDASNATNTSTTGSGPTYTAYAPDRRTEPAPKSYHVKLGNDYAPYRSYRINISTTKDIT